jgi:hypothetical protein
MSPPGAAFFAVDMCLRPKPNGAKAARQCKVPLETTTKTGRKKFEFFSRQHPLNPLERRETGNPA